MGVEAGEQPISWMDKRIERKERDQLAVSTAMVRVVASARVSVTRV